MTPRTLIIAVFAAATAFAGGYLLLEGMRPAEAASAGVGTPLMGELLSVVAGPDGSLTIAPDAGTGAYVGDDHDDDDDEDDYHAKEKDHDKKSSKDRKSKHGDDDDHDDDHYDDHQSEAGAVAQSSTAVIVRAKGAK